MKLSDESVEAAARAIQQTDYSGVGVTPWNDLSPSSRAMFKQEARAALTAAIEAEIKAGNAKEAAACGDEFWYAHPVASVTTTDEKGRKELQAGHFPVIILKVQE